MLKNIYAEGFDEGATVAEGFFNGTMNARDRRIRALNKYRQPLEAEEWRRGFNAGYESECAKRPSAAPPKGIGI